MKRAVAGVRVGLLPGRGFVVNPTVSEMEGSTLDMIMAGTAEAVLMIEGFCDFLTEEQMLEVRRADGIVCARSCVRPYPNPQTQKHPLSCCFTVLLGTAAAVPSAHRRCHGPAFLSSSPHEGRDFFFSRGVAGDDKTNHET